MPINKNEPTESLILDLDGNKEIYDQLSPYQQDSFLEVLKHQNAQFDLQSSNASTLNTNKVGGSIPEDIGMGEALLDAFIQNIFYVTIVLIGFFLLRFLYRKIAKG